MKETPFPTPKQRDVLDYVKTFQTAKGYPPTLQEVADYFDKAVPTIHQFLEALESKGLIEHVENKNRGWYVKD